MGKALIAHDQLLRTIRYEPETGRFYWLKARGRRQIANPAGCISSSTGYRVLQVDGRKANAACWAWYYMTGSWPSALVDHKNRKRLDDSWTNLRAATFADNAANAAAHKDSSHGRKGVHLHSNGKWRSQICVKGKRQHLGLFDTVDEAAEVYRAAASKQCGEFAIGGSNR